jgi:hypothetical protein
LFSRVNVRDESGAVAVVVAIVLAFVLVPLTALGAGTYVRSTTASELTRSADSGSLAGAAEIPLGDTNFLTNYLDATSGGETGQTLQQLGLSYGLPDPLTVACQVATANASAPTSMGKEFADTPTCAATYLGDLDTLSALRSCAQTVVQSAGGGPGLGGLGVGGLATLVPSLANFLPALLHPGIKVTMTWRVTGPMDQVFSGVSGDKTQDTTSIARRRFKNVVVVPMATAPVTGQTINLNPTVSASRDVILNVLNEAETLLRSNPLTAPCADVFAGAQDDILDIVDPPAAGPSAGSLLNDASTDEHPILAVVYGTTIPFLDFVPVCVNHAATGGGFVGRTTNFGACDIDAPGGFRASLRNS